jgi:hypothetical protein
LPDTILVLLEELQKLSISILIQPHLQKSIFRSHQFLQFGNKIIPFLAPLKKIPGFIESLESHEDYRVLGMASEFYTSQVQNERIVLTHKSRKSIPVIPINTPFSKENLQTLLKVLSQHKY